MFSQFFQKEEKRISFEDMQAAMKRPDEYILINTLPLQEQECLIRGTVSYQMEEQIINNCMTQYKFKECKLVVYGKNANDLTVDKKVRQLLGLGFVHVYVYPGGLFEWLLLQDVYGSDEFPTTKQVLDILKFRGTRVFF
jgi:hypothetical protein